MTWLTHQCVRHDVTCSLLTLGSKAETIRYKNVF
jgi:hypothetical protein